MENSIELHRLIPIRVINLKNAAHPNELIFWYEPSPELTAAMPVGGECKSNAIIEAACDFGLSESNGWTGNHPLSTIGRT